MAIQGIALPRWPARPVAQRPLLKSSDEMLLLFLTFQQTRCRAAARGDPAAAPLEARCDGLLAELLNPAQVNPSWAQAYQVERELLLLLSGAPLLQALRALLDRADAEKNPHAVDLRKSYETLFSPGSVQPLAPPPPPPQAGAAPVAPPAPPPDDLLMALALSALEKLQWARSETFRAAPLKRRAVGRLVGGGLLIFLLFVLPYAVSDCFALSGTQLAVQDWSWMPVWTALTAGLLGSFFSRLWTVQTDIGRMTLEDVESAGAWGNIALRAAVGMLGALVIFFFLQSGIVAGSFFPHFSDMGLQNANLLNPAPTVGPPMLVVPSPALAQLVVWSFVAGFSQKLVPDILAKTEAQLSAASAQGTGAAARSP